MFANELRLVFRRVRTAVFLAGFAVVPILLGVVIRVATDPGRPGDGPNLIGEITQNGVFLVFASMFFLLPLFLPVGVAVVAGDSVAGEAGHGTLRYLLVAPAGRVRLLAIKLGALFVFCAAVAAVVLVAASLTGAILFPRGDLILFSGATVSYAEGLGRASLVALYVAASLTGVATMGLFASTLTEVPLGAMAATVAIPIVSQILDVIPQLAAIGPYLPTHDWLTFTDVLRDPIYTPDLLHGLLLQLIYVAIFASAAYARMTTRDVA